MTPSQAATFPKSPSAPAAAREPKGAPLPSTRQALASQVSSPQKIAARVALAAAVLVAVECYEVNPLLCAALPLISLPAGYMLAGAGIALHADALVGQSMIGGKVVTIAQQALLAAIGFGFLSVGFFDTKTIGLFEWYAK